MPRKRKATVQPVIPSRDENLEFVRSCFRNTETLIAYVEKVNLKLAARRARIELASSDDIRDTDYSFVVNNLLLASDKDIAVPDSAAEGLAGIQSVSLESIIEHVIANVLHNHPKAWDAQNENLLVAGFTSSGPSGIRSHFRTLDAKSPSAAVQLLLSPPFRKLFSRLGHVVSKYLLSNVALLVPAWPLSKRPRVQSVNSSTTPQVSLNSACSMMQLCGSMPVINPQRRIIDQTARSRAIVLRTDVLNRTICQQSNANYLGSANLGHDASKEPGTKEKKHLDDRRAHSTVYNTVFNRGLPPKHVLQSLTPDTESAIRLFHEIFSKSSKRRNVSGLSSNRQNVRDSPQSVRKRLRPLIPILKKVIEKTGKRSFVTVLNEFCQLPSFMGSKSASCVSLAEISQGITKSRDVARFVVACLRQAVPVTLLGSTRNMAIIEEGIHSLIRRRTRNESFCIETFCKTAGFKIIDIAWLQRKGNSGNRVCNPTDLQFRQKSLLQVVLWLFKGFLLPLLMKNFYATETEMHLQRVVYYRIEVWAFFTKCSMANLLRRDGALFTKETVGHVLATMRAREQGLIQLGASVAPFQVATPFKLRFIPKARGARPIQRMQVCLLETIGKDRDSNSSVRQRNEANALEIGGHIDKMRKNIKFFFSTIRKVIYSCCNQKPFLLGSSVFCLNDVYRKVVDFKQRWIQHGCKKIYAVAVDIERSFDTVSLEVLSRDVLPSTFFHERYVVLKYAIMLRCGNGKTVRRFESYVCRNPGEEAYFPTLIKEQLSHRYRNAIFVDLVRVQVLHRNEVLGVLREFLLKNIVVLPTGKQGQQGTSYYRQIKGVGQGNPLSALLTSLFYGFAEQKELAEFLENSRQSNEEKSRSQQGILMRQIDDTFFASTDRSLSQRFAEKMSNGWGSNFGFSVNHAKTRSSLGLNTTGKIYVDAIPWCGLLIHTKNMEFTWDFSQYRGVNARSIRDTLTIDFDRNPGQSLIQKASSCFRPKLHPILLDAHINSRRTIALNIYQAALFAALKICAYALAIHVQNEMFFGTVIKRAVSGMCGIVRQHSSSAIARRHDCNQPLSSAEIQFLVVHAFHWVVTKKLGNSSEGSSLGRNASQLLRKTLGNARAELSATLPRSYEVLQGVTVCESNKSLFAASLK